MSFKINLRNELLSQNISVKDLSNRLEIPYNSLLSYINYKEAVPNVIVAYKIANALNVSVEYLVTGKPEDKISYQLKPTFKELSFLPSSLVSCFASIVHMYYEIFVLKKGDENAIISKKTSHR